MENDHVSYRYVVSNTNWPDGHGTKLLASCIESILHQMLSAHGSFYPVKLFRLSCLEGGACLRKLVPRTKYRTTDEVPGTSTGTLTL